MSDITTYYSCSYFDGDGSDLRNQTLVIKREGGNDCVLSKTTPNDVAVPCAGNATATRVNDTHVLLKTNDNLGVKLMEYGRDNEPGKFSEPIAAGCPYSSELLEVGESPHDHPHQHYGIYAVVVIAVIIFCIIAFFIYKKYKNRRKLQQCNGHSVTFSRCSNNADTEDGEDMTGTGQAGPREV